MLMGIEILSLKQKYLQCGEETVTYTNINIYILHYSKFQRYISS